MNTYKLKPQSIFNVDKTGVSNFPKTHGNIIVKKRKKEVEILASAERGKNVTVELCVSASGGFLASLFFFSH